MTLSQRIVAQLNERREELDLNLNQLAVKAGWHWQKTKRALTPGRQSALPDYEHLARTMDCRLQFERTPL